MAKAHIEIPLRLVVLDPPSGVVFALQHGKNELRSTTTSSGQVLLFDLSVRVDPNSGESPNLLGPYVQGPKGARFVYLNSGTLAGQSGSCWTRRAKIGLQTITWNLIEQVTATSSRVLEARIQGKSKDGGPACATVPLLDGAWKLVASV